MSHVSHVTHVNIQTFSILNSLDTTHDQSQPSTLWREVPASHAGPTNVKEPDRSSTVCVRDS